MQIAKTEEQRFHQIASGAALPPRTRAAPARLHQFADSGVKKKKKSTPKPQKVQLVYVGDKAGIEIGDEDRRVLILDDEEVDGIHFIACAGQGRALAGADSVGLTPESAAGALPYLTDIRQRISRNSETTTTVEIALNGDQDILDKKGNRVLLERTIPGVRLVINTVACGFIPYSLACQTVDGIVEMLDL